MVVKKIKIEHLDRKGRGVGYVDGRKVAIYFTVPGDIVKAKIFKRSARLIEILEPSPLRVEPRCEYFGKCGGCKWQNIRYSEQLKIKQNVINSLFGHSQKILPSDEFRYRNRMDFIFWDDEEKKLGLREPERYDKVVDIDRCLLISKECNHLLREIKGFVREKKISIYDFKKREGLLRYLVIREGKFTNERMVILLTSMREFNEVRELKLDCNIVWSRTSTLSDVSYGEEYFAIRGKDYIREKLLDFYFRITPNTFFQTNSKQAEKLCKIVLDFSELSGNERVMDLYCGVGTFGIVLAQHAEYVVGIESSKEAIKNARINAKENGIENIEFYASKVEKMGYREADVIIIDPPRSGLHPKAIRVIKRISPKKIIYVSCNPKTQKRDIEALNYKIEEVKPIDMFPHTPHIENVVLLVRG
ncbi:MAG: 23S rRNA (uracil(1939)-C(5))-methyltransferase RlmD [Thermoplasmata archaeon]|nr:MAG: 23S rRNA (uracil(1939)-C(5))-methyltransferase RlmD [Thermoplasmata archaeon]